MVDLVLQQLRSITLDLDLVPFPFQVLIPDPDPVGPRHSNQKIGEGEAVVPDLEVLVPDIDDLRIDQRPGLVHLDVNHPDRRPNLWGRDSPAAPEA